MTSRHTWKFFRAGGFDQAQIDSGADLLALRELDQKLWVALSCPTRGIEFDTRTLDLIDQDEDGRVHANEVLGAIAWAGSLLKNSDLLVTGAGHVTLADIDDSSEEGQQVLASAQYILSNLGKPDATEISLVDMADIEKFVAGLEFNGDGVISAARIRDAAVRATVEDIVKCRGPIPDRSGEEGVSQETSDAFFAEVAAWSAWQAKGADASVRFLADDTQAAADAFDAVKEKVSDYFTRCRMAAYDTRAAAPLSRSADDYKGIAAQILSARNSEVAAFPLATIEPDKPLPLTSGVNPAWQKQIDALRARVIEPQYGKQKESLLAAEWETICDRFVAFEAWQADRTDGSVAQLGAARLAEIHASGYREAIDSLIAQDKAVEGAVKAIHSVEKLLRYNRDLYTLVNNFVSFRNFYTGRGKALFQLGTLYLDGRSCDLCVRVEDIARHAEFAQTSGVYLAYCDCVRKGGTEKMSIAAAFTAGDSDFLTVGRNGLFYDRKGQDWDATIVRILDHPISIRQAFWSPYKKLVRFISAQLEKMAASRAAAADEKLLKTAADVGAPPVPPAPGTPPPAPPAPFDVGKFAGIFAAIGLAIGAIGGILASIVSGILGLEFWQIPLALLGLILLISGPAMLLAWFKLKKRNLGPVLDANGWAINARARINIPFGTSLTKLARLPEGSRRSLADPYEEGGPKWPYIVLIAGILLALFFMWKAGFFG